MIPQPVNDRLAELQTLCQRHRVRRLAIFGSAARGEHIPERSDLDFLVEFEPLSPSEHADAYFGLLEDLRTLFNSEIDLVEPSGIRNRFIRESIAESEIQLYDAA